MRYVDLVTDQGDRVCTSVAAHGRVWRVRVVHDRLGVGVDEVHRRVVVLVGGNNQGAESGIPCEAVYMTVYAVGGHQLPRCRVEAGDGAVGRSPRAWRPVRV